MNTDLTIKQQKNEYELDNYDFCGYVISNWHLNVCYSLLLKLQSEKSNKLKGILLIDSEHKRITNDMLVYLENINIVYYFCDKNTLITDLKKIKFFNFWHNKFEKPLYFISPLEYKLFWFNFIILNKKRNIQIYKIDEGTGSYCPRTIFDKINLNDRLEIIKGKTKSIFKILCIFILKIKGIKFNSYFIYTKKIKRLKVNDINLKYLRKIYKIKKSEFHNNFKQNQILILKEGDVNILSKQESLLFYIKLIKIISKQSNLSIYIKRHPNDTDKSLKTKIEQTFTNVNVIDTKEGIEDLYSSLSPKYIFAGHSTATFSLHYIYDVPVYDYSLIYKDLITKKTPLTKAFIKELKLNYQFFKNDKNIHFLKKIEDIKLL